jgi:hypothetical protein
MVDRDTYHFNYWIWGDSLQRFYSVRVGKDESLGDLRSRIIAGKEDRGNCNLWSVSVAEAALDGLESIKSAQAVPNAILLPRLGRLSRFFPGEVDNNCLNLIVEYLEREPLKVSHTDVRLTRM